VEFPPPEVRLVEAHNRAVGEAYIEHDDPPAAGARLGGSRVQPGMPPRWPQAEIELRSSVVRWLRFDVIDHEYGHGALVYHQFKAELFLNSVEK
jgi:hypothetical protein